MIPFVLTLAALLLVLADVVRLARRKATSNQQYGHGF